MSHGEMSKKRGVSEPPDGGWGWMVVFASFMIHVIADGVAYTFGLFIDQITPQLGATNSATAWIASLMAGMTYSAGPVASAFANRFGCRTVSIMGSIIAAFGFAISYYASSVAFLYVSAGLLGGLGLGLIYLPAIVMVTCYFEKKRAFATGIAVCGSGFGTFALAPVIKLLLDWLGWRLAFVATGGILFSCIVFSVLFRPIQEDEEKGEDHEKQIVLPVNDSGSRPIPIPNIVEPPPDYNEVIPNGTTTPKILYRQEMDNSKLPSVLSIGSTMKQGGAMLEVKQSDTMVMSSSQPALPVGIGSMESLNRYNSLQSKKRHSLKASSMLAETGPDGTVRYRLKPNRYSTILPAGPILERKDVFYSGSLIKIPDFSTLQEEKSSVDSADPAAQIDDDDDERPPGFVARKKLFGCIAVSPQFSNVFKTMLQLSLLLDPVFLLFAVSNFFTSIGYNVPYIYLVAMADKNANIDKLAKTEFLLSIVGISNTVSRITLGYLSDKKWVNRLYLYNASLAGCGVATILAAHATTVLALQIYSAVFGALVGVYVSLTSVILVDLLGLDKLTNAFGLLMLFQGIGTVIGPPIVGLLIDTYENYILGFGLAGTMIAFSGVILFAIPLIQNNRRTKNLHEKSENCKNGNVFSENDKMLTNNNKTEIFSKAHEKIGDQV